jgi:hypothetical protein
MFGATSTLARVLGDAAGRDPWALLHWFTGAAVLLAIVALTLLQAAYAGGQFAVPFAVVQIADPVTAFAAGALLLGEPLPASAPGAAAAAALIVAGTVALARTTPPPAPPDAVARPDSPPAPPAVPPTEPPAVPPTEPSAVPSTEPSASPPAPS